MNGKMIRRGLAMLGIVTMTGVTGAVYSQASALPLDRVNPGGSPCARGAKVMEETIIRGPGGMKLGTLKLVISPTCHTAWAFVQTEKPATPLNRPGIDYYHTALVTRIRDGKTYRCDARPGFSACNSPMVNDKDQQSYARGSIFYKGRPYIAVTRAR